jgi:hypothetical protein
LDRSGHPAGPADRWSAPAPLRRRGLVRALGIRVGDEEREIPAGESILVTRGTPHSYWNPNPEPAHYLLVMTPRIHQLIEALHSGERSDWGQVFEEHDSELLA